MRKGGGTCGALSRFITSRSFGALAALVLLACSSGHQSTVKHDCHQDQSQCFCSAFTQGDETAITFDCSETSFASTICCADDSYPDIGPNGSSSECECVTKFDGTKPADCFEATSSSTMHEVSSCNPSTP